MHLTYSLLNTTDCKKTFEHGNLATFFGKFKNGPPRDLKSSGCVPWQWAKSTFDQRVPELFHSSSPDLRSPGTQQRKHWRQPLPSPLGNLPGNQQSGRIAYQAMWQLYRVNLLRSPCPFICVLSFHKRVTLRTVNSLHLHQESTPPSPSFPPLPFSGFLSLWFLLLQLLRSRTVIFSPQLNKIHPTHSLPQLAFKLAGTKKYSNR